MVAEVYTFLPVKDYAYFLRYTRARVSSSTRSPPPRCGRRAATCASPAILVVGPETAPGETSFEEATALALRPARRGRHQPGRPALWIHDRLDGRAEAVCHLAHDPLVSFHNFALDTVGYDEPTSSLPVPKLFFGYARDAATLFTFGVGATGVVFREPLDARAALRPDRAASPDDHGAGRR